jgi:pimeloyl-ACP methyl ester carboxylesterase
MTTTTIDVATIGPVPLTYEDAGTAGGRPTLLLHSGGGPQSIAPLAAALGAEPRSHARILTPVHPGYAGTPRPAALHSISGLAQAYVGLLDALDLRDVTLVGNSIGGWIAAEMALTGSRRIASCVLVGAVGIQVDGHPVTDTFSLPLSEIADFSYHEPDRFRIDPAALSDEQQQAMAGNRAALDAYTGRNMSDPQLRGRLAAVTVPTLVVWGEADRIVDADYGRAYADAIPGAEFRLLPETGHLPQLETPQALVDLLLGFTDAREGDA